MLKDESKRRKKIAGTLGWVVVRITQPMPLTSWRAASRAPLRILPPPSPKVSETPEPKLMGSQDLYHCSIFRVKS
jgi:hypothetical protein